MSAKRCAVPGVQQLAMSADVPRMSKRDLFVVRRGQCDALRERAAAGETLTAPEREKLAKAAGWCVAANPFFLALCSPIHSCASITIAGLILQINGCLRSNAFHFC